MYNEFLYFLVQRGHFRQQKYAFGCKDNTEIIIMIYYTWKIFCDTSNNVPDVKGKNQIIKSVG